MQNFTNFAPGGMAEWSNAAVLKTVVPSGTGGSNPSSSATTCKPGQLLAGRVRYFCEPSKATSGSFCKERKNNEPAVNEVIGWVCRWWNNPPNGIT